jgi:Sap, sulfolipid-1-addressing protein
MVSAIVQLIPVMIGAAVVPICIILVLLLLRSPDGLSKAVAFAGGQIVVRVAQGVGFGSEMGFSAVAQTQEGTSGIVNTLLLAAGVLMWITALKIWAKQEDPDAPPPQWIAKVGSFSSLKAFGLGLVATAGSGKQWLFAFYALGTIRATGLPGPHRVVAFTAFILGAHSLVLLPIGLYAFVPEHSSRLLETATRWLERNNQTIVMGVSIIFGTFFVFKGFRGLLG